MSIKNTKALKSIISNLLLHLKESGILFTINDIKEAFYDAGWREGCNHPER